MRGVGSPVGTPLRRRVYSPGPDPSSPHPSTHSSTAVMMDDGDTARRVASIDITNRDPLIFNSTTPKNLRNMKHHISLLVLASHSRPSILVASFVFYFLNYANHIFIFFSLLITTTYHKMS